MKLKIALLGALCLTGALRAESRSEMSRGIFAQVLSDPSVINRLQTSTENEVTGVRQVFVPNGRNSHQTYEVRYGEPDGTGGYRSNDCIALDMVSDPTNPENRGHAVLRPSEAPCQANQ